jgi:hypothetical protein
MYCVYFGLIGWEHNDSGFYPDDLPLDWRLSFYNTQLRCVYVPFETWKKATPKEVDAWLHETKENFRFILEVSEPIQENLFQLIQQFGERAVLSTGINIAWIENVPDLRELAAIMQSASVRCHPAYFVMRNINLTLMRQINELIEVLGV